MAEAPATPTHARHQATEAPAASESDLVAPSGRPPAQDIESPARVPVAADKVASAPAGDPGVAGPLEREWGGIIKALSRYKGRRFNLGSLLRACRQRQLEGDTLSLEFTHQSHMERMKEEMDNPESRRTFLEAVTTALGITTPLNLLFTALDGREGADKTLQSPLVQAALGMGGKILEETKERHE